MDKPARARYEFECRDTGIGMSPEYLTHLFDSFSREQDSRIDKTEGSGLGLSIVKKIVDMMDGEIRVESEKQKGTVFTVTLEFTLGEENAAKADTFSDAAAGFPRHKRLDGLRVLLAEDNELNTEIAEINLIEAGAVLDCVANGKEAVEKFAQSEPFGYSVILLDMQMPIMTGCEAAAAIRKLPRADASTIPIIAMTANAFEDDIRETRAAGMNAHVSKPIDFGVLFGVMRRHID
jgi:CheY-like chemotaxis protein